MEIVVGISGASGVGYGIRLLEALREKGCVTHLIITDSARKIMQIETDSLPGEVEKLAAHVYAPKDYSAPVASGSPPFDALDMRLDLAAGATKDQLLAAMRGHVLAEAQIMGTYQR